MASRPRRLLLTLSIAVVLAACGPAASTGTAPTAPGATSAPPTAASSAPDAGQTDTAWGRIWDAIPAGFPVFPGATPADDATAEPASARFAVEGGDPQAIATWLQDALEQATFSTLGLNGPGEDGGYVIDSAGEGACRIQTTIAPLGTRTFVSVRYGADCPGPWTRGRCMLAPSAGTRSRHGGAPMQSARPRDLGALILAIGVLLVLFVVSLTLGSPLT